MRQEEFNVLQNEIKRNRMQAYVFLALLMVGVATTVYFFTQLQKAKEEIEFKNTLLQEQKESIKAQKVKLEQLTQELITIDSIRSQAVAYDEKQAQQHKLVQETYDLVRQGNTNIEVKNISQLSVSELKQEVTKAKATAKKSNKVRQNAINQLFSNSETGRVKARKILLNEYSTDKQLIPQIIQASKGKINLKNKDSYYQFIYILTQMDSDILKANQKDIMMFVEQGEQAGLNGNYTKKQIREIMSKIK